MNKNVIILISFVVSMVFVMLGAYLKIMHLEYGDVFIAIGLCFTLVFTILALYEIHSSKRIDPSEKIVWTIGFIFFNTLAALLYFLVRRKAIVAPAQTNL